MKLVEVQTVRDEDREFIVQICRSILAQAEEGKVKQIVIAWEDLDGIGRSSQCSRSHWTLIGLMERIKFDLLNKEGAA